MQSFFTNKNVALDTNALLSFKIRNPLDINMDKTKTDSIKADQDSYFATVKEVVQDDGVVKINKYKQIRYQEAEILADGSKTWTDEYVGPQGAGFVINEEKVELGKTYRKATNVGPETYRTVKTWVEVTAS